MFPGLAAFLKNICSGCSFSERVNKTYLPGFYSGRQIMYKLMTLFCIPFIVLYFLSHVKIVVCICMYSILNKILFTLILSFSDIEKPFSFSDLPALTAKSESKKRLFQRQRRLGLPGCLVDMKLTCTTALQSVYHCLVNDCYLHGCRVNCLLPTRLPDE